MNTALLAVLLLSLASSMDAASCDSIAKLAFPDASITLAQSVAAGELSLEARNQADGAGGPPTRPTEAIMKTLPAFCRVAATLKPSADSDIKMEVWLPESNWNHKYQAVGNGGWAGTINYAAMAGALHDGYATSSTDTGHSSSGGSFALGHPEKLVDFGWRSEHEMTVKSKAVIKAFYGDPPKYSYWIGCSSGGKQGLKEAQQFPDDFDGIVAGAPVLNWVHRSIEDLWIAQAALKDPASHIPMEKYPLIHQAAIAACDAQDGLKDGLISNPPGCQFDPAELECKGEETATCLTHPQVQAARAIYAPALNPRTGEKISPGFERGSELGWRAFAGGPAPFSAANDHFKFVVFQNPNWDWRTFDLVADAARADEIDHGTVNATDADLKPFAKHGKMILYHGWTDTNITPRATVDYFEKVTDNMGGAAKTAQSVRLFMIPGMNHCGGGEGPNVFNMTGMLEHWVEDGKAPDQVLATHITSGKPDRTRPLCPYPQTARYNGSGDPNDAANFVCK
ncbi:MAG TPA: tannase/feruloyl esterase family alpha/beta hydrolase [Bryobacteraceae bacterium]|nr:tannase/feruloyl esterase family alpha/beta hydrolase [Bryobacteraceae bacterium]